MTTKRQTKTASKQVRLDADLHRKLKMYSAESGVTITRLLSKMCKEFFEPTQAR